MTEPLTPDPFGEARSRAINALKNRWIDSLWIAVIAWTTVTLTIGGVAAGMVSANMMDTRQAWTAILAVVLATGPVTYLALEIRRLLERSDSLEDLLNVQRQYEVLIADARAERDETRKQVMQSEQMTAALQVALISSSRKEGSDRGEQ